MIWSTEFYHCISRKFEGTTRTLVAWWKAEFGSKIPIKPSAVVWRSRFWFWISLYIYLKINESAAASCVLFVLSCLKFSWASWVFFNAELRLTNFQFFADIFDMTDLGNCSYRCGHYSFAHVPLLKCQCDEACKWNDDCCHDYEEACGKTMKRESDSFSR